MSIKQAIEALESCDPGDYSTGHVIHPSYDEEKVNAALAALRSMPQGEPVAWIRFCGDGLYEGPVMNCDKTRMENVRHKISEWTPLCAANVPETNFGNTQHTEAVRMSEAWQPIEAAPKDDAVIVFTPGGTVGEAWYDDEDPDEAGWYWANTHWTDVASARPIFPTHWHPLPPPPVEQATAARLGVKMGDVRHADQA